MHGAARATARAARGVQVPRHVVLPRERMEEEFLQMRDAQGRPIEEFHSTRILY